MPPRDWRMRVQDILDSIAKIQRFTNDMTLETFQASDMTVDAVVRNLPPLVPLLEAILAGEGEDGA